MIVLGLTGSIGMGKSTAAGMLHRMGIPICDSDAIVHRLLARGGAAVAPIGRAFDGVVHNGAVDRAALGRQVFGNAEALRTLEEIVHPLVHAAQARFLETMARRRRPIVVLDVPLLFEGGSDRCCDATIVVTAPRFLQEQRVLRRPGMTRERLAGTLARQMPDAEKRRRADFVVQTGIGRYHTLKRLKQVVASMEGRRGHKWPAVSPEEKGSHARSSA